MLTTNLKYLWRYFCRDKIFSIINIAGLTIGIASALLIYVYVSFQMSFDDFHQDADRIYRVLGIDKALGVTSNNVGIVMPALGPAMAKSIPEVESVVRISARQSHTLVTYEDKNFYTEHFIFAEHALFDVFSFPLIAGQRDTVLIEPNTVVVTKAFATLLFGDEDPMGKVIRLNGRRDVKIEGVMADNRRDSHLQFDMIMSLTPDPASEEQSRRFLNAWNTIAIITYTKLREGSSEEVVERKIDDVLANSNGRPTFLATLQPLGDVHLDSENVLFDESNVNKGDRQKVFMLATVAVFLLLIAAFNFMNLSTAHAAKRAKEVGVRKVAGALRTQLARQFIGESLLMVAISAILGFVLAGLFSPWLALQIDGGFWGYFTNHPGSLVVVAAILIVLGLLAGSYPAFVLSSFPPIGTLRGAFANTGHGLMLRRVLVVTQFTLSIGIIIGMLIVNNQLSYMQHKDVGFDKHGIVNIRLVDQILMSHYQSLNNELAKIPEVEAVAGSNNMPGFTFGRRGVVPVGIDSTDPWIVSAMAIDDRYLAAMNMDIVEGRGFSSDIATDVTNSVIINESAARAIGWEQAVGKTVRMGQTTRTVVGVVNDFHFASMRHSIEPVFLFYQPRASSVLSIKLNEANFNAGLAKIREAWQRVNPSHPFEYTVFAADFDALQEGDKEFFSMLFQFTFIAIFIACLGLFGLVSFSASQKTKEIGIRKVLGATAGSVVQLISREYVLLIIVANVIAWPLAYLAMNNWLSGFAYRTALNPWNFLLAGLITAVIAMVTVSREIFRVSQANPVLALRYE